MRFRCIILSESDITERKGVISMKSTGIVRKMDRLGRIVIPKELRRVMKIEEDVDAMEIFTEGNTVILKKYEPSCVFCNESDPSIVMYKGHNVCRKCILELEKSMSEN